MRAPGPLFWLQEQYSNDTLRKINDLLLKRDATDGIQQTSAVDVPPTVAAASEAAAGAAPMMTDVSGCKIEVPRLHPVLLEHKDLGPAKGNFAMAMVKFAEIQVSCQVESLVSAATSCG